MVAGQLLNVKIFNGAMRPPTQCVVPAFPTTHGGHVRVKAVAVVGGIAGSSACAEVSGARPGFAEVDAAGGKFRCDQAEVEGMLGGMPRPSEAVEGAFPKPPEAGRFCSGVVCGCGADCTAVGGTDEHDTKVGCDSSGNDHSRVGEAGGCSGGDSDGTYRFFDIGDADGCDNTGVEEVPRGLTTANLLTAVSASGVKPIPSSCFC